MQSLSVRNMKIAMKTALPAKPSADKRQTPQQTLGREGEDRALVYLENRGLTLVERNFRCKMGEIDLIMRDADTLVFVEVRRRNNSRYGGASASITPSKQKKLVLAAQVFLSRHAVLPKCRFDVIAMTGDEVEWLKNAIEV